MLATYLLADDAVNVTVNSITRHDKDMHLIFNLVFFSSSTSKLGPIQQQKFLLLATFHCHLFV